MNPLYGPFTAAQRDTLSSAGDMLALLPLPGCRDLSHRLDCIAQTRRPNPDQMAETIALATGVQRALAVDASPDRWLDEVSAFAPDQQGDIIADLIAQRRAQADQVNAVLSILRSVTPARTSIS